MFKIEDYNNKKIAIHVKTQEEYDKLIILIKEYDKNCWNWYSAETCIVILGNDWEYGTVELYKKQNYQIVEFSDIMPFTKSDLQDTDIVTFKDGNKFLGMALDKSWYNENLEDKEGYNVIKVERPTNLVTVFEREEKMSKTEAIKQVKTLLECHGDFYKKDIEAINTLIKLVEKVEVE